ncbi:MAG: molybdopterin-guanine dinucleotide biosynthesis protein B [Neomegalonema sp.]|nr:molybdopterin-guanine dinucleotide biosynthesis protein B [Neomegalonema sp.]
MERLVACLCARGFTVSTLKHAHHAFDIDHDGKDSFRHRAAGASEVLIASAQRWALMHELRADPEPEVETLLSKLAPVDLVLIEGFKQHPHPKLEVQRRDARSTDLLAPHDPSIRAVASDHAIADLPCPRFSLDAVEAIADFVLEQSGLPPKQTARKR